MTSGKIALGKARAYLRQAPGFWLAAGFLVLVGLALGEVAFGAGTIAAILALAAIIYLLVRKGYRPSEQEQLSARRSVSRA